ncbi:MAG TPA: hypothetical protein VHZ54_00850 [Solirubrobacterales bacterium]|nr:hypothetical protein [Solirubrobacterales bacterium]
MPATVHALDTRRTETPNATMITLASPPLGPIEALSLWRGEMEAGATRSTSSTASSSGPCSPAS